MFECSIGGNQYFYSPLFSLVLINSDKHVVSPSLFSCDSVLSTLVGVELSADWLSFLMFFWLSLGEAACERASRQRSVCPGWASPPACAPHTKPSLCTNQAFPLPQNQECVRKENLQRVLRFSLLQPGLLFSCCSFHAGDLWILMSQLPLVSPWLRLSQGFSSHSENVRKSLPKICSILNRFSHTQ